jgi:integrase/recombinase XerC
VGCGPWEVGGPLLLGWFSCREWATETKRAHRTTYRVFYRWGVEEGLTAANPALALPRVRPSKPNPMPTPDGVYALLAGWSLVVHGKGSRERLLPVPDSLAAAIRDQGPGYLFPGNDHGHLSPWWVGRLVTRLMPEGWTMHKLRHRAGTRWHVESGGDLMVVQELLGHASLSTVRAYVRLDADRLRAVVNSAAA